MVIGAHKKGKEDKSEKVKVASNKELEIKRLEEELSTTKYNKATQKHFAVLKAKLAKLKEESQKASGGAAGLGYGLKKQGDATVLLVGFPSVGKSTLLNALTNAESKVAAYDFTTLTVVPGTLVHKNAVIQIFDIPGLVEGAAGGKGRGKEVISVARSGDLIILLLDASRDAMKQMKIMEAELYEAGFRLNQRPPEVVIKKKSTGGFDITSSVKLTHVDKEFVKSLLIEFDILSADVIIRQDVTQDQLIDCLMKNRSYVPCITVVNKTDIAPLPELGRPCMAISADRGVGLDGLKDAIWDGLGFTRIYLKRIGREPDMKEPLVMRGEVTAASVAMRIHREMARQFKFARIWGPSSKFPGQKVGMHQRLQDGDIVELHTK
jgi:small GTP-binding protein